MADKKISALTSASTPLAGTEVLPIVQSSATVKVSIATLTEGRSVMALNGVAKAWDIPAFQITNAAVYAVGTETGYYANSYYSGGWKYSTASAASGYLQNGGIHQWYSSTDVTPVVNGPISFQQIATLTGSTGNLTLSIGNLVIGTSGKGIDFSATPGTGTSELLADYEEGTWTPTQGSGLTVVGTFSSSGTYTKIGRTVFLTGTISATTSIVSGAGGAFVGGLPYASATNSIGGCGNSAFSSYKGVRTIAANSFLYSVDSQAATTEIVFSITYQA